MDDNEEKEPSKEQKGLNELLSSSSEIVHELKEVVIDPDTDDYEYAKANIQTVVEHGQSAMLDLIDIAKRSGHPRAFEVLTAMMNSIVAANRELMEVKKVNQIINKNDADPNEPNKGFTQQNLFVGTTAELAKIIEATRKKNVQN